LYTHPADLIARHRHQQPRPPWWPVRVRHLPPPQSGRTACAARPKVPCAGTLVPGARSR